MTIRTRIVVVVAALAMLAAACNEDDTAPGAASGGTGASGSATTSTSPTEGPSPTEVPSPTPIVELEDGRHFGLIESVDTGAMTMVFDLAYFYQGDEANQIAAERGDETPVPNDYYIVNDNPKKRTLVLAPDVDIELIDWGNCCDLVPGELQPFADAFDRKQHPYDSMYQGGEVTYWVTVQDGMVVLIEEQYLP
jgi:hypothetical protein